MRKKIISEVEGEKHLQELGNERARLAAELQMARSRLVRPEVVEEAINQAVDKMIHDISFVQKLDDTIGAVDMTPEEKYEMYREMVLGTHHDTLVAEDEGEYIGGTDVQQYIFTMKRQIFKELTAKGGKIQGWDKSIKITGSIESPTNPKGNVITLPNSARPQMGKLHRKTSFHFHR